MNFDFSNWRIAAADCDGQKHHLQEKAALPRCLNRQALRSLETASVSMAANC